MKESRLKSESEKALGEQSFEGQSVWFSIFKKTISGFRERAVEGEGTNAGTKNCLVTCELERKMQNEKRE